MAVYLAVLMTVIAVSMPDWSYAAPSSCPGCHPVHHAASGTCTTCHRGDDRTSRKEIAHHQLVPGRLARYTVPGDPAVSRGSSWLKTAACRRCHTIDGTGNRLAANLDRLAGRHPQQILNAIVNPVEFMPDFRFDDATASDLVNAIAAYAGRQRRGSGDAYTLVRFTGSHAKDNLFEKKCGGCHRILNRKTGPHGWGNAGPNLSGVLTPHFPGNIGNRKLWNEPLLKKWLQNPRKMRLNARMPPVKLERHEFRELLAVLDAE